MARAVAPGSPITLWIKGDPQEDRRGDCPFSHRAALVLAAKGIAFNEAFCDLSVDRPDWFKELNAEGTVPVLIRGGPLDERGRPAEGFDGEIVPDSGKITEWAEEHFPNPSLKPRSEEEASLGGPLFKLMKEFVFADPKDSEAQKKSFEEEMATLNAYLEKNGPLFGGDRINATDCLLAPRLYHASVVLKHFQGYDIPESMGAIHKYLEEISKTDAWKATLYPPEEIVHGWTIKLQKAGVAV